LTCGTILKKNLKIIKLKIFLLKKKRKKKIRGSGLATHGQRKKINKLKNEGFGPWG